MADKDDLSEIREIYKDCQNAWSKNHDRFREDYRFCRLGEQWHEADKKARKEANRPCLTINKVNPVVKQIVNDGRQNKPAIKVRPADDTADPETAEVMSGLIRNIEQTSGADAAYDTALDHAASGGFGFLRVVIDHAYDDSFDLDILIKRVNNPLNVLGDPWSTEVDSSDWNHAFVTETMALDVFKQRYPDADPTSWDADNPDVKTDDGEDVTVAEYWCRKDVEKTIVRLSDGHVMGEAEYAAQKDVLDALGVTVTQSRKVKAKRVYQKIVNGGEVLVGEKDEKGNWPGKYIPIIPVYGDEILDSDTGERIFVSAIHYAKDAQRMFNYWRTVTTELVALAPRVPYIGPEDAFNGEDSAKWESANNGNYAYISYKGAVAPQRQPIGSEVPAGALQEALSAADDVKATTGLYDASLGARSNETSGVAIERRKMEGDTATFNFTDNLSRAIRHTGRILIDLIPKVYKQDRVIRVLGEDGQAQNVKLGPAQPTPEGVNQPGMPKTYAGVYDLAAGKYDLVVDSGPSYSTRRVETAEQIMALIQNAPDVAVKIGDILAKNLDWKDADLIAERLKPSSEQQIPPEVQAQIEEGKMMLDKLSKENEQLRNSELKAASDYEKAKTDQASNELERQRLALEQARLPLDEVQKQIELITAQTQLVQAQASAKAITTEADASAGEKTANANAMTEFAQAAAMLTQAAAAMSAGIADLQVKVSQPRTKQGRAIKLKDGSWVLDAMEVQA